MILTKEDMEEGKLVGSRTYGIDLSGLGNVSYQEFLENKSHLSENYGFDSLFMPDYLFPFQKDLINWSVKKGRSAIFADTGLGKTIIQLVWSQNIVQKTNKRILILTPLAVGQQTKLEAEKFAIDDVERSKDGKFKNKIVMTNYERLHFFDPSDFIGVVCDECFAPDTKIQVIRNKKLHEVYIKDCKKSDFVLNSIGVDKIKEIKRKKVKYGIKIGFNGKEIISSPNHPYFTQRGWVRAKEIQKTDFIISTDKAMRILRGKFQNNYEVASKEKILQSILFSEMEDETTGNNSESSFRRGKKKKREINKQMVKFGKSESKKTNRKNSKFKTNEEQKDKKKSFGYIEKDRTQTFSAWGKWSRDDIATAINEGCTTWELDTGICYITGKVTKRLSDKLQSRFSFIKEKNCNRSRWSFSQIEKKIRQKKGQETGYFGVESFEVLELGHPELDKYRDENGSLYFYDLEIEQHPSFTINGCLVHNSSILKNFDGKRKSMITDFMKKVPYRLLCSATPAPNDFVELGTSSEALGYMGYMDMLTTFFKCLDNTIHPGTRRYNPIWIGQKFILKAYAERPFWRWVSSWARAIRKPSDFGYDDGDFILPELIEKQHIVKNNKCMRGFFPVIARTFREQRKERRLTIKERCQKVYELTKNYKNSVVWCHLNDEGNYLEKLNNDFIQISGRDSIDKKEEKLIAFSKGKIKTLITKPKIGAFGLNWQHCNHMTFFPSHSFEQYYQGVRRCWRFGQKNKVFVDIVTTEGERDIMINLQRKMKSANKMFSNLVDEMLNELKISKVNEYNKKMELPEWL